MAQLISLQFWFLFLTFCSSKRWLWSTTFVTRRFNMVSLQPLIHLFCLPRYLEQFSIECVMLSKVQNQNQWWLDMCVCPLWRPLVVFTRLHWKLLFLGTELIIFNIFSSQWQPSSCALFDLGIFLTQNLIGLKTFRKLRWLWTLPSGAVFEL